MRLCRFHHEGADQVGFYNGESVVPLMKAAQATAADLPESDNLLDFLPGGKVVVCGTPEEVAAAENSITGQYLRAAGVKPSQRVPGLASFSM